MLWQHRTPSPFEHCGSGNCGRRGGRRAIGMGTCTPTMPTRQKDYCGNRGCRLRRRVFPITYTARGKQYVAMPAEIGGGSWSTLITPELAPEIRRPNSGNVLMVLALPGPPPAHRSPPPRALRRNPLLLQWRAQFQDGVFTAQQATRGRLVFRQVLGVPRAGYAKGSRHRAGVDRQCVHCAVEGYATCGPVHSH